MIEGLKFELSRIELVAYFKKRIAFHHNRANFYDKKARIMANVKVQAASFSNRTQADLEFGLDRTAAHHRHQKRRFQFMLDHVVDDVYQLSQGEIEALGIMDEIKERVE